MGSFRPQIVDPLCSMYSIRNILNLSMDAIPVGYVHGTIAQCKRTVGGALRRTTSDWHRCVDNDEWLLLSGSARVHGSWFETAGASALKECVKKAQA